VSEIFTVAGLLIVMVLAGMALGFGIIKVRGEVKE